MTASVVVLRVWDWRYLWKFGASTQRIQSQFVCKVEPGPGPGAPVGDETAVVLLGVVEMINVVREEVVELAEVVITEGVVVGLAEVVVTTGVVVVILGVVVVVILGVVLATAVVLGVVVGLAVPGTH